MAVRGALGEEWDSEEVQECCMRAEGPDRAGLWDQLEEGRDRGRVGGTRRTASLRRLPGALVRGGSDRLQPLGRLQHIHCLLAPSRPQPMLG